MNMTKKKGMSQTLALIVAASVLMMTALTVIFLAQGALGDFGQNSAESSCSSAVISQCQAALAADSDGTETISAPAVCRSDGEDVLNEVGDHTLDGNGQVTCNS